MCLVHFLKAEAKIYFKVNFVPILSYQNFTTIVVYFDQHLGAAHSKRWSKFGNFLKFFGTKNIETAYFNQCLECTAPKHWSKYTTLLALLLALICWKLSSTGWKNSKKAKFFWGWSQSSFTDNLLTPKNASWL